jgi:hypothetical protein
MDPRKFIIGAALVVVMFCVSNAAFNNSHKEKSSLALPVASTTGPIAITGNAFVNSANSNVFIPHYSNDNTPPSSSFSAAGSPLATYASPAAYSGESSSIASSTPYQPPASQIKPLALPVVPDSELAVDPTGAASPLEYMIAFNTNYKNIAFDAGRFDSVLKDENGIPLFIPSLIGKAVAEKNFAEIKNSLEVQRDFADADIAFMESVKVASGTVAFDKEVVGTEKLTVQLADRALAVASGALSQEDFNAFYGSFLKTAAQENADYVVDMKAFSLALPQQEKWPYDLFSEISPVAYAQLALIPFGGPVINIVPLLLDYIVTIGPPWPAQLNVTFAFLASPMFFFYKSLVVGSCWLGIYLPPGTPIMVGTSLPACPVV